LLHLEGEIEGPRFLGPPTLLTVSFAGAVDSLPLAGGGGVDLRISPDGRSVAYTQLEATAEGTQRNDLYIYDLVTGANRQVTFDGKSSGPIWSPDGTELLFGSHDAAASDRESNPFRENDLFVVPADNSREPRLVLALPGDQVPNDWPARDTVVFETSRIDAELFVFPLADSAQPRSFLGPRVDGWQLQVAPGGKFAAFSSLRHEQFGVYLRDYPSASREWKIPGEIRSSAPRWAPDGKTVYFWHLVRDAADTLYQATFDPSARVPIQSVRPVPGVPAIWGEPGSWDLHPDGDRFLVTASGVRPPRTDSTAAPRYIVTLNWFRDLAAMVGAASGKP
jgi:Tol biopolymer transport system component